LDTNRGAGGDISQPVDVQPDNADTHTDPPSLPGALYIIIHYTTARTVDS